MYRLDVGVQFGLVVRREAAALDLAAEALVPKVHRGHVLLVVDLLVGAVVTEVALEPVVLVVGHLHVVVQPVLPGGRVGAVVALVRLLLQVYAGDVLLQVPLLGRRVLALVTLERQVTRGRRLLPPARVLDGGAVLGVEMSHIRLLLLLLLLLLVMSEGDGMRGQGRHNVLEAELVVHLELVLVGEVTVAPVLLQDV